ncbi:fimbrial protein [Photorhabdus luminescens]|uniref:Type 1 fimbrial protein n=1 Tax=Photorhabdus luminescens subsp. sonorensis TaxID=1173677 RepID=A0A5C4RMU5_PHOLU|nr:hypothetical protein [Photorhabdus luminescens]TNH45443.1 hypothetical protein EP164_01795 [Photorhabdus luminescens subsp. sonorensis]
MKKQILKTSVLAAVLLSMGMGMAHASTGGATVNVMATLGAATCELDVSGTGISGSKGAYALDMGMISPVNVSTNIATANSSGKELAVKLANCSNKMGSTGTGNKFTPKKDIKVQILGQTLTSNNQLFNANANADVGVAVYDGANAITKGTPITIADTTEFDPASPTDGKGMKKFKVALVSKSSNLPAAQEVIAPVTFQIVYQ